MYIGEGITMAMLLTFLCVITFLDIYVAGTTTAPPPPNFVFILADDLGQYSIGYNNPEILTPAIDNLATTGVILNEFYVYMYCSPSRLVLLIHCTSYWLNHHLTRASFLTGRYPWKAEGIRTNLEPLANSVEGTNLGFTFLPQRLKQKGYATHHIGKWHQGHADYRYTPTSRGFDTTYGFLAGEEDHFTQALDPLDQGCGFSNTIYDNWVDGAPAAELLGGSNDQKFTSRATDIIHSHAANYGTSGQVPLFIYLAYNSPHSPIQALERYQNLYPAITYPLQKTFYGMLSSLDEGVKNVTIALQKTGLWSNTIFIWQADNGSPIAPTTGGVCGSNHPLRGSKASNWEGGVRVPALVNGGFLPDSQRGKSLNGIGHIADWYATFLTLAGLDPSDPNPYSPSPIDSFNLWPWISGQQPSSPRTQVVLQHTTLPNNGLPAAGAIRVGNFKLLVGPQIYASWYGGPQNNYFSPNQSVPTPDQSAVACSYKAPCLFDVVNDPTEHNDLAPLYPSTVSDLLTLWHSHDNDYHIPLTAPPANPAGYCARVASNGYIAAPFTTVQFPLNSPSPQPVFYPTPAPSLYPTPAPSPVPTPVPTPLPTSKPSHPPSKKPVRHPTYKPKHKHGHSSAV